LIPFGFGLLRASFGRYCHCLSLGRAFKMITDYRDGFLIEAEYQSYDIALKNL
jgi:hypothetical protein